MNCIKPVYSEKLNPSEYLSLTPEQKKNIAGSRIIPANLDDDDFGKIEVTYKTVQWK